MTLTDDELKQLLREDNYPDVLGAFAELRAERDVALERERVLREAVEYPPEWLIVYTATPYVTCQWCHAVYKITGYTNPPEADHKPDCLRQRALGISKGD